MRAERAPRIAGAAIYLVGTSLALAPLSFVYGAAGVAQAEVAVAYLFQFVSFTLILLVCVASTYLLLDASIWTTLFCVTAGYTTQNLSTGATELVAAIAHEVGVNPSEPLFYFLNEAVCLALIMTLTYLLLGRRIDREGLAQMESHSMLLMMPIVSLVIIGYDLVIKILTGMGIPLGLIVMLRLFHGIACVATLWIAYQMLYRTRVERDRAVTKRLLVERERQFSLSKETIDAINIKCHDLRHQVRSLGAYGAVMDRAALDDVAREISIYDSSVQTGNEALDTILTEKSLLCKGRGIALTTMADGAALARLAPADLYALIGNALDNAIDATSELDDPEQRSISVVIRQAMGCGSVHVENYFSGARSFSEEVLPKTTKRDTTSHGFGMRSMRQIAQRYGGTLTATTEGNVFALDVMIPLDETLD